MQRSSTQRDAFLAPTLAPWNADLYPVRQGILTALKANLSVFRGVLLDVGCGTMPYRPILEPLVKSYIGMDLYQCAYRAEPDLRWDGANIPMWDGAVDCVLLTEVL